MQDTYKINIAGCERELQICKINEKVSIAAFIMFSDVEITIKSAKALLKLAPKDYDVIMTAESKGIPLAYEMARQSGKNYILARKSCKLYMTNPVKIDVKSITTEKMQALYLDSKDAESLKGKKVLIVDDVISTGESVRSLENLISAVGATVAGRMAVLAEGDAASRKDIIYLQKLPLFINDNK
jgi:adenine phosphoribosyltransferase